VPSNSRLMPRSEGADSPPPGPPSGYPLVPDNLPEPLTAGAYVVSFARSLAELDAVQRLRFEVFNLELGEGLAESYATGRDHDRFDPVCHHLIVSDVRSGAVVGTYRMQTGAMAAEHGGFYSADEFRLDLLPQDVMDNSVEVGRAAVAKEYRNRQVLFLLWRGIAAYLARNRKRYLFGCCSLTSQDGEVGRRVMQHLERTGHVHPTIRTIPQPGWECYDPEAVPAEEASAPPVKLPQLFGIYLRYGAKVCGLPALDRYFKTIDYLVLMDVAALPADVRAVYFG